MPGENPCSSARRANGLVQTRLCHSGLSTIWKLGVEKNERQLVTRSGLVFANRTEHDSRLTRTGRVTQYKRRPLCGRLWLFASPLTERSAVMSQEKYIGMDVHQATISVAVLDSGGKLIMERILETKAATILEFLQGLHGRLSGTFEEGTSAAWLHDLLKPHVTRLVVCDPRKNALLTDGSKSDRIDARKLAELLRGNQLTSD